MPIRQVRGLFRDSAGNPEAGVKVTAVPQLGEDTIGRTATALILPTTEEDTSGDDGLVTLNLFPYSDWRPDGVVYEVSWERTVTRGDTTIGTRRRSMLIGVLDEDDLWLHDPRLQVQPGVPFGTSPTSEEAPEPLVRVIVPSYLVGIDNLGQTDRGRPITIAPDNENSFAVGAVGAVVPPEWEEGVDRVRDELVTYEGDLYQARANIGPVHNIAEPDTSVGLLLYRRLGAYRGTWRDRAYLRGEIVYHTDDSAEPLFWIANSDIAAGQPAPDAPDQEQWRLFAGHRAATVPPVRLVPTRWQAAVNFPAAGEAIAAGIDLSHVPAGDLYFRLQQTGQTDQDGLVSQAALDALGNVAAGDALPGNADAHALVPHVAGGEATVVWVARDIDDQVLISAPVAGAGRLTVAHEDAWPVAFLLAVTGDTTFHVGADGAITSTAAGGLTLAGSWTPPGSASANQYQATGITLPDSATNVYQLAARWGPGLAPVMVAVTPGDVAALPTAAAGDAIGAGRQLAVETDGVTVLRGALTATRELLVGNSNGWGAGDYLYLWRVG